MKRWTNMIILAAVTAGLIFVSVQAADAQPFSGKGMRNGGGPGFGMSSGHGPMGLMGIPNLSDKQLGQILDLQKEMQMSHIKMMNEKQELMEEIQTLSDDPDANRRRLGEIQQRMGAIRLQMSKDRVAQQERMQNILTDEQWEELAIQRAEHMQAKSEMSPESRGPGFRGPRGVRGSGYGMHKGPGMHGHGYGQYPRGSCGWGR